MKRLIYLIFLFPVGFLFGQSKDYSFQPVPFTSVRLSDKFWLPRIKTNQTVTIPASFERCDKTGRVKNFQMAAARSGKFCTTYPFDDTDIYKTIEGASFSLSLFPDKAMEAYIDSLIVKIASAVLSSSLISERFMIVGHGAVSYSMASANAVSKMVSTMPPRDVSAYAWNE